MKPTEYKNLEQDLLFKRHYLGKIAWWKNFLLIAPTLLIFIGIAGILFIAQQGDVVTWYTLPYLIILLLGSIWLKAIKKHLQNKVLQDNERFLVCAARAIDDKAGYYYFIFSKDNKRHNEQMINKLADSINISSFSNEQLQTARKQMIPIETSETETTIYLKAVSINKVLRTNRENIRTGITPMIYISPKNVFVIRRKDLK